MSEENKLKLSTMLTLGGVAAILFAVALVSNDYQQVRVDTKLNTQLNQTQELRIDRAEQTSVSQIEAMNELTKAVNDLRVTLAEMRRDSD